MVKINLGILNLFKGLVDGVRSKALDGGGHLGVEGVLQGLALPLIDLLNLGLILSVREGVVWTSLWRNNFVTFGSRAAVGAGEWRWKANMRNVITSLVLTESSVLDILHFLSLKSSKSSQDMERSDSGGSSLSSLLHHSNSERMFMNRGHNSPLD